MLDLSGDVRPKHMQCCDLQLVNVRVRGCVYQSMCHGFNSSVGDQDGPMDDRCTVHGSVGW
jgi:hypothetical protein